MLSHTAAVAGGRPETCATRGKAEEQGVRSGPSSQIQS